MSSSQDLRDQIQRQGHTGSGLPLPLAQAIEASRMRAFEAGDDYIVFDPEVDYIWGNLSPGKTPKSYFDYFYTGQDVRIYIEGAEGIEAGGMRACQMPLLAFAYKVEQQKTPLYGFWSYAYDAMMRGTRVVTGAFTIAVTSTNRMTDLIATAAKARVNQNLTPIRGLDVDEQNIETYWGRNIDNSPEITGQNLWSVHPPFNFIIVYGMQTVSLENDPIKKAERIFAEYKNDQALYFDVNERLVATDSQDGSNSTIIENVELTSLQVEYTPEGDPCAETYGFIARDVSNPRSRK